jgi:hypothetical protein
MVGIFLAAMERTLGSGESQTPALAIKKRNANTQRPEIHSCYDRAHGWC